MKNVLRWLAVLPGSIICAVLSAVPLHFVLYSTLTGSGIVDPYPQSPERLLGPLVAALAFVWSGSRIAPSRKVETAVVLFGAWLLLVGGGLALGVAGARLGDIEFSVPFGGLAFAGAIAGAFAGLHLARLHESRQVERHSSSSS